MNAKTKNSVGGVVLCGGKSSRMGRPKLSLPFGGETMLERVVRLLGGVVAPIVVAAAPEQELPKLPAHVRIARDEQQHLGPLVGLNVGLWALRSEVEAAYVTACDAPLLRPEFVRGMIAALGGHDMAIPREGEYHHPLAAVYRTGLADIIGSLIEAGRMRPLFLLDECDAVVVSVDELRLLDPRLDSLRNTNTEEEYLAALRDAGLADARPGSERET